MVSLPEKETTYEGYHSGRRLRHPAVSADKGHLQAIAPGIRQTYDLLSPVHIDAGGNSGHSDYLHPHGYPPLPGASGRRQPFRHSPELCRSAQPRRSGSGLPHRRGIHRRCALRHGAGRQHFLRQRLLRHSARCPGECGKRPCHHLRLLCPRPGAVRRGGIRRKQEGHLPGGKARPAQEQLRRHRPVLLPCRGCGSSQRGTPFQAG